MKELVCDVQPLRVELPVLDASKTAAAEERADDGLRDGHVLAARGACLGRVEHLQGEGDSIYPLHHAGAASAHRHGCIRPAASARSGESCRWARL